MNFEPSDKSFINIQEEKEIGGMKYIEVKRYPAGEGFFAVCRNAYTSGNVEKGESITVLIEDKDRKPVFDFSEFMPIVASDDEKFYAMIGENFIKANWERLVEDPRDIMIILHEIGHFETHKDLSRSERHWRIDAVNQFRKVAGKYNKPAPAGSGETSLQNERDAWAKAIRIARDLRLKYKVDIFSFFKTPDEFFSWMRLSSLRTYELALEKRGHYVRSGEVRVQKWIKNNPEEYQKLMDKKKIRDVLMFDNNLKKERDEESREFVLYLKENYPDLCEEIDNIGKI